MEQKSETRSNEIMEEERERNKLLQEMDIARKKMGEMGMFLDELKSVLQKGVRTSRPDLLEKQKENYENNSMESFERTLKLIGRKLNRVCSNESVFSPEEASLVSKLEAYYL